MRLYLIRHARPAVAEGICYGSSDLPVFEDEQRRVLANLLPVLPKGVPMFSSPLQRCRGLAQQLADGLGIEDVLFDRRLAEMHFGAWEMRNWDAIARTEIDAWSADLCGYRPGGGESVLEVAQRVFAFHEALSESRCDAAIIVCHAGTIRLLTARLHSPSPLDMALHAAKTSHRIAYGELTTIDC
ncbi:phosphoglycerate mutase [Herbaspirillum sp. HC18]|nr:phosphoglycerate mutase [Herbaspirillum sp. HC18]